MTYEPISPQSAVLSVLLPLLTVTFAGALCVHSCSRRRCRHIKTVHKNCTDASCEYGAYTEVGAVMEMNGEVANGRILSHDRALPEIPASASGVASTDDDDEEDEGHYDVISKSRRAAVAAAAMSSNSRQQNLRFCHPYEIVAGELDATYSGIREDGGSSTRQQPAPSSTAAAAVVASDPLYAGITDGSDSSMQLFSPTVSLYPGISSSFSTAMNSQHMQRLQPGGDFVVEPDRLTSAATACDNAAESPLLPPRNGNGDVVDGAVCTVSSLWPQLMNAGVTSTANSAAASNAAMVDPIVSAQGLQLLQDNGTAVDVHASAAAAPSSIVVADRVANYSSVTARESLENLRRRQQQQQQERRRRTGLLMSDEIDVDTTYDTIDYDVFSAFPGTQRGNSRAVPLASDNTTFYNNGSDLYAEIGTGPNSEKSSTTYAKVSDLTADLPPAQPGDLVENFASQDDSGADDIDMGHMATSSPRPAATATESVVNPSLSRPNPVYAVVSRNRRTVSQSNPASSAGATAPTAAEAPRDLYTRVTRRSARNPGPANSRSTVEPRLLAAAVANSVDGYAGIDDPPQLQPQLNQYSYTNGTDFYDVISDDVGSTSTGSDFDPNYETVLTPPALATSSAGPAATASAPHTAPTSTSAASVASGGGQLGRRRLLIREHIYDEVSSTPRPTTNTAHRTQQTDWPSQHRNE